MTVFFDTISEFSEMSLDLKQFVILLKKSMFFTKMNIPKIVENINDILEVIVLR